MSLFNDKLNTWAGTKGIDYTDHEFGIAHCFKWLVPKVRELGWDMAIYCSDDYSAEFYGKDYRGDYERGSGRYETSAKTSALALCLAISKLIEQDVDNAKQCGTRLIPLNDYLKETTQ